VGRQVDGEAWLLDNAPKVEMSQKKNKNVNVHIGREFI
jgi:hypothetical protein